MNETVTLRHPDLPPEQVIRVDRRRIGPRLASGWEEVPDLPKAVKTATKPAEPESSKRRSRNTTEEQ